MSAPSVGLFVAGLVGGYVISGLVLGPGVLAVLAGGALGAALAWVGRAGPEGPRRGEQE